MRVSVLLPALAALLFLSSCSLFKETTDEEAPKTTVEVVNNNFYDVNLFIVRSGQRIRLGFVQSNRTSVLDIPHYIANAGGMVFFVADPVGGTQSSFSQERFIEQGRQLRIVIPAI